MQDLHASIKAHINPAIVALNDAMGDTLCDEIPADDIILGRFPRDNSSLNIVVYFEEDSSSEAQKTMNGATMNVNAMVALAFGNNYDRDEGYLKRMRYVDALRKACFCVMEELKKYYGTQSLDAFKEVSFNTNNPQFAVGVVINTAFASRNK